MTREKKYSEESDRIEPDKMSDKEIEDWLLTCRDTLIVLKSEDSMVFARIYEEFMLDLRVLEKSGRIGKEELIEIIKEIEEQL